MYRIEGRVRQRSLRKKISLDNDLARQRRFGITTLADEELHQEAHMADDEAPLNLRAQISQIRQSLNSLSVYFVYPVNSFCANFFAWYRPCVKNSPSDTFLISVIPEESPLQQ